MTNMLEHGAKFPKLFEYLKHIVASIAPYQKEAYTYQSISSLIHELLHKI